MINPAIILSKLPGDGLPIPGEHLVLDTSRVIDLDNVPLNGGFLTKTLVLSPEPYMRERMRDHSIPSYTTPMIVGAPLVGAGVVVVLRSEREDVRVGDYMYGQTTWEAYTVQPYVEGRVNYRPEDWPPETVDMDSLVLRTVPDPEGAYPLSLYTNALGLPGLTAFAGLNVYAANAKQGNTIFVSSGASGVGSMVIQLAKLKGMKVIASVGSDEKVAYTRSIGADIAFNYKTQGYASMLAQHGPINLYWDNVGGPALEAALDAAAPYAQFIICGASADYTVAPLERHGPKNTSIIFKKRLTIHGLLIADHLHLIEKFLNEIPALIVQGQLRSDEFVTEGIENAPEAFVNMLTGNHGAGKPVVIVAKT